MSEAGLFVPLTLPGERVRVTGAGSRRELTEIVEASPDRVVPPCPHFGVCGGCALQHWRLEDYRQWKVDQVRLALTRARIDAEVELLFAAEPHSRRRLSLHARRSGRAAVLGFKERRSWALAAIQTCVIADAALVAALPRLRELALPFLEHPKSAPILHVTLTDSGLDIDVTGVERKSGGLSADALMRVGQIAAASDFARVTLAGETAYQSRAPTRAVRRAPRWSCRRAASSKPSPARRMPWPGRRRGVGGGQAHRRPLLRRWALSPSGSRESLRSWRWIRPRPRVRALTRAFATAPGLKSIRAETRDLDRRPMLAADLAKIDVAVFDPPRAGAQAQAAQLARLEGRAGRRRVVQSGDVRARRRTSCMSGGYRLERVAVVDQFLWSPHIELVAVFSRVGSACESWLNPSGRPSRGTDRGRWRARPCARPGGARPP